MTAELEHLTCTPEQPCGIRCGCEYCTTLFDLESAEHSLAALRADRSRYRDELVDPERVFAVTTGYGRSPTPGGAAKIHLRSCPFIRSSADSADAAFDAGLSAREVGERLRHSGSDWRRHGRGCSPAPKRSGSGDTAASAAHPTCPTAPASNSPPSPAEPAGRSPTGPA